MSVSRRALIAAPFVLIGGRSPAQSTQEVDVLLVLAIDASGSVDEREWELNKRGYAEALVHPDVLKAIRLGPNGAIGLCAMRWGNPMYQEVILPWSIIDGFESAQTAAATLSNLARRGLGNTSISSGIAYSAKLIDEAPFKGIRRVIDVSGDGYDNTSRRAMPSPYVYNGGYMDSPRNVSALDTTILHTIRDEVVEKGIVINGLPILTDMPWLDTYYTDSVIGGRGSFMIPAKDFDSFAVAVRRKLILEIADLSHLLKTA